MPRLSRIVARWFGAGAGDVASPDVVSPKGLKLGDWLALLQEREWRLDGLICRACGADYVQTVHVSGGERLNIMVKIVGGERAFEKTWTCPAKLGDDEVVAFIKDRIEESA